MFIDFPQLVRSETAARFALGIAYDDSLGRDQNSRLVVKSHQTVPSTATHLLMP